MALRIYTRTGDAGETALFGGQRVSKDDLRVEAYGAVDELNAILGQARIHPLPTEVDVLLLAIQHALFQVGADLATPSDEPSRRGSVSIHRIMHDSAAGLEAQIDRFEAELPALRNFILPGGCPAAAALHVCRVVCRRAERRCVALARALAEAGSAELNPEILCYLNRLSDLLFVLARYANQQTGVVDVAWNQ